MQLHLLGSFSLTVDGVASTTVIRTRVQDLLAYLVLRRGAPVSRSTLASALWPDVRDEQALKNLRTLLTRLRDAIPDAKTLLISDSESLRWRPDAPCTVDIVRFQEARAQGLAALEDGSQRAALRTLSDAVAVYSGDLLPGHDDEWILHEREHLHRAWLDTLDQCARLHSASGAHVQAQEVARRLLHLDALHEGAATILMRSQLAVGDRAGALRTYHACAAQMREELGVDPSAEMQAVYDAVLFDERPSAEATTAARAQRQEVETNKERAGSAFTRQGFVAGVPLVGRERAMAWLRERWSDLPAALPQVVVVAGEAGIGKTRLVQEFMNWVGRDGGGETAIARAYSAGATAYAPIAAWLRSEAVSRRLRGAPAHVRSEAARLLPELLTHSSNLAPPEPITESWQRQRFFQATVTTLLGETPNSSQPLLLVLEDAQWADAETLAWLPILIEAEQSRRFILLLTVRNEESPSNPLLMRFLQEFRRKSILHEYELSALNLDETTALAELLAHNSTRHGWNGAKGTQLYRETEGNPLFIVEMMRAGAGEDAAAPFGEAADYGNTLQLPVVILATLRSRLEQLTPAARDLADCAAVLGREFRYIDLAHSSHLDEEGVVRGLDELWRKRIVREQGSVGYDFSHDKIRAVAYYDLSNARRRMLHRRAAEAVLATRSDEQGVNAEIVAHYEAAGDFASALPWLLRAIADAHALHAASEAIALHKNILSAGYARLLAPRTRCDQLLHLGDLLTLGNRTSEAEEVQREAEEIALALDDSLLLARARLGISFTLHEQAKSMAARDLIESAMEVFEKFQSTDDMLSAYSNAYLLYLDLGELEFATWAAQKGLEVAEAAGNSNAIVNALCNLGELQLLFGKFDEGGGTLNKALALARQVNHLDGIARSRFYAEQLHATLTEDAWSLVEVIADAARAGRQQIYNPSIGIISYIESLRGDFLVGAAGHLKVLYINLRTGTRLNISGHMIWAARCIHLGGWLDLAEEILRAVMARMKEASVLRTLYLTEVYLADLLMESGRFEEAAAILNTARLHGGEGAMAFGHGLDLESICALIDARVALARGNYDPALFAHARSVAVANRDALTEANGAWWHWVATGSPRERESAIETLRRAYTATCAVSVRDRLEELTGERVEDPPPFPDTSSLIPRGLTEEEMYAQYRELLREL